MDPDPAVQPEVLEEGEPEVQSPEGEEQQAAEGEEQPQQSKSQNAKQRLRRKLRNEQAIRAQVEEENRQLKERFDSLEQKLDPVLNPPPPRPSRVDFDSDEDYEDELFKWRDSSKPSSPVREPAPAPAPRQAQESVDPVAPEVRKNWESQLEDAADKYDDFDEALVSIPRESMSDTMTFAIMESDKGGEVAYFLGTNHAEAERIANMTPTQQVREIDKLANKFKSTTSNAPEPITPTKGGDSPVKDPAKMTPEEYRDYRREQGMPR